MSHWDETIEDFLADQPDWDTKTAKWYRRRLVTFTTWLVGQEVTTPGAITLRHVKRFFAHLRAEDLSWSTRNGCHTALGKWFRWLRETGYIERDLFAEARLPRPRKPRRVRRDLPLRIVERLIGAAEVSRTSVGLRDAAMMRLLLTTGLRRLELVSLAVVDCDLDGGEIVIRGKFGHERVAFLTPRTVQAVCAWLVVRPECDAPTLFVSVSGRELLPTSVNQRLCHWRKHAGVSPEISVSPHRWRHTFASQFIAAGGDAFSLRDLLGHSDVKTTEVYVSLSKADLKQKAARFGPRVSF